MNSTASLMRPAPPGPPLPHPVPHTRLSTFPATTPTRTSVGRVGVNRARAGLNHTSPRGPGLCPYRPCPRIRRPTLIADRPSVGRRPPLRLRVRVDRPGTPATPRGADRPRTDRPPPASADPHRRSSRRWPSTAPESACAGRQARSPAIPRGGDRLRMDRPAHRAARAGADRPCVRVAEFSSASAIASRQHVTAARTDPASHMPISVRGISRIQRTAFASGRRGTAGSGEHGDRDAQPDPGPSAPRIPTSAPAVHNEAHDLVR